VINFVNIKLNNGKIQGFGEEIDLCKVTNMSHFNGPSITNLHNMFEMNNLGLHHYFIKIKFTHGSYNISLYQPQYTLYLLQRFHMEDCKPSLTPIIEGTKFKANLEPKYPLVDATLYRSLVGNLNYLTHMQPHIFFIFSMVSKFM
jgi:hypothetical protein